MTTLAQILDLAKQAKRSPYARRVLFDALIDRYGERFLGVVAHQQLLADAWNRSRLIYLDPYWLNFSDSDEQPDRHVSDLMTAYAFPAYDVERGGPLARGRDEVFVTAIHPRARLAARPEKR